MLNEHHTLVQFLPARTPTTIDNSDKYFPKVRSTNTLKYTINQVVPKGEGGITWLIRT